MTYKESLLQPEWNERCNQILNRDKYTCKDCGRRGYHKKTFYHTDSIDEVSEIINEELLGGLNFKELYNHVLNGNFSSNTIVESTKDTREQIQIVQTKDLQWDTYENLKVGKVKRLSSAFLHHIDGKDLSKYLLEKIPSKNGYLLFSIHIPTIITDQEFESFNFSLHHFSIHKMIGSNSRTIICPFSLLKFKEKLTERYNIEITDNFISITFKNYGLILRHYIYNGLNVHHKYYVKDEAPWDYPDDALISLCENCHQKRHESPIPRYRSFEFMDLIGKYYTCDRCGGSGYLSQYKHIQNGICFKCLGEGVNIGD